MYKYKYKQEADMRACGECMHMKILAQAAVKLACYSCNFLVPISTCVLCDCVTVCGSLSGRVLISTDRVGTYR